MSSGLKRQHEEKIAFVVLVMTKREGKGKKSPCQECHDKKKGKGKKSPCQECYVFAKEVHRGRPMD